MAFGELRRQCPPACRLRQASQAKPSVSLTSGQKLSQRSRSGADPGGSRTAPGIACVKLRPGVLAQPGHHLNVQVCLYDGLGQSILRLPRD